MRVSVCVTTYRRPAGLERLLRGLGALRFEGTAPDVEIVVIDNDEAAPARPVCAALEPEVPFPIVYDVEPRRGISFGRAAAIRRASADTDFIAFIDDDEAPDPGWLEALLRAQRETGADVVTGPVLPRFEHDVPAWIRAGRFFERRRHATGTALDRAFTHNVLVARDVFRRVEPPFNGRRALTGGEDSLYFQRVARAGFAIVWADDAIVHEWQPPSRTTVRWLVQRMYRVGNSSVAIAAILRPGVATWLHSAGRGVVWLALGTPLALVGWIAGRHRGVQGLRLVAYALGILAGLVGHRYEEYRRVHGQ